GDGGLSVLDYKTGARHGIDGLADDPVAGGTRLQLLLYGLAAAEQYRPRGPVTSSYWFVGGRGRSPGQAPLAGVGLSEDGERRLAEVLGILVRAIETGTFPANPGPPTARTARGSHCTVCPFDRICPSERLRDWQRKRSDPWVADYLALGQPA
ncbi:MAG TPA: PD-(D/E)XK nuclease family protein, partial [Acidimicrobiales bacterium]|nr:PD-(D/E)XK nuclease family protein [Acidimicrobiales bacterium]